MDDLGERGGSAGEKEIIADQRAKIKKLKTKLQVAEKEILDLQSEFERERQGCVCVTPRSVDKTIGLQPPTYDDRYLVLIVAAGF